MDNKEYKIGIIINYNRRNVGACLCGQYVLGLARYDSNFQCDKCGNDSFYDAIGKNNKRIVIPHIEVLRKDNRGFKAKRTNLSVIHEDDKGLRVIKENLTRTVEYDMVDKSLKVWRKDEIEYDSSVNNYSQLEYSNQYFFRSLDASIFINKISNEVTRGLYNTIWRRLSYVDYNRKANLFAGLVRFSSNYQWMQILANAGIPDVERFFYTSNRYFKSKVINSEATKPHEILNVPKFMLEYIREDVTIDYYVLESIQNHLKQIDINKLREIMSIVKDEGSMRELSRSIETIMQIHIDYEYTNLKKLILYLFREVRLYQGIDNAQNASTYLRDYVRMSRAMDLEWERYPKSLKKEHDIVQMNYNLLNRNENKRKEFKLAVEKKSYQNLVFEDKKLDLVIIAPEETEDLVKEGNELSHCVSSYVDDVTRDKCKILFLRHKEEPEKPLATIEVRGLNIRQARGFANRQLNDEQKEFLSIWAEEKNLVEAYY